MESKKGDYLFTVRKALDESLKENKTLEAKCKKMEEALKDIISESENINNLTVKGCNHIAKQALGDII